MYHNNSNKNLVYNMLELKDELSNNEYRTLSIYFNLEYDGGSFLNMPQLIIKLYENVSMGTSKLYCRMNYFDIIMFSSLKKNSLLTLSDGSIIDIGTEYLELTKNNKFIKFRFKNESQFYLLISLIKKISNNYHGLCLQLLNILKLTEIQSLLTKNVNSNIDNISTAIQDSIPEDNIKQPENLVAPKEPTDNAIDDVKIDTKLMMELNNFMENGEEVNYNVFKKKVLEIKDKLIKNTTIDNIYEQLLFVISGIVGSNYDFYEFKNNIFLPKMIIEDYFSNIYTLFVNLFTSDVNENIIDKQLFPFILPFKDTQKLLNRDAGNILNYSLTLMKMAYQKNDKEVYSTVRILLSPIWLSIMVHQISSRLLTFNENDLYLKSIKDLYNILNSKCAILTSPNFLQQVDKKLKEYLTFIGINKETIVDESGTNVVIQTFSNLFSLSDILENPFSDIQLIDFLNEFIKQLSEKGILEDISKDSLPKINLEQLNNLKKEFLCYLSCFRKSEQKDKLLTTDEIFILFNKKLNDPYFDKETEITYIYKNILN